jgi:drug/metabolite transporter (DMT)-like permease
MDRSAVLRSAEGSRPQAFGLAEWGLLTGVALIWGSSFVLIAYALESFSPGLITFGRLSLGLVALALFPAARAPIARSDWPTVALLGVVWMAVPFVLFPVAQQWISSALTGMLNGAMPLFSALFAALLLKRLPRRAQAVGLLIGFGGVVLLTIPGADSASSALGITLVLIAVTLYGLAVNLAVPLQQEYGGLPVLLRSLAVAVLLTLPLGVWSLGSSDWSWGAAVAVVALGVFGTGVAFVMMTTLVGRAGATRGAVAIYFIPIVAVVLGVAVRGDVVTVLALFGVALVIVGAYLTSRRETPVSAAKPPGPATDPADSDPAAGSAHLDQ